MLSSANFYHRNTIPEAQDWLASQGDWPLRQAVGAVYPHQEADPSAVVAVLDDRLAVECVNPDAALAHVDKLPVHRDVPDELPTEQLPAVYEAFAEFLNVGSSEEPAAMVLPRTPEVDEYLATLLPDRPYC